MTSFDPFKKNLAEALSELPESILLCRKSVRHAIDALLEQLGTKHGLVSRQEFDIQSQVLLETRRKMILLEEKIQALSVQKK
jgi:BMFP domain-containing protein YqiC